MDFDHNGVAYGAPRTRAPESVARNLECSCCGHANECRRAPLITWLRCEECGEITLNARMLAP